MEGRALFYTVMTGFWLGMGCQKDDLKIEAVNMVGHWKYEYEFLNDGTKEYDNPYALLGYEYSDAFILNQDNTGNSVWYGNVNGSFSWDFDNSILVISVSRPDQTVDKFEYQISNMKENTMEFRNPENHRYFMAKQ